MFQTTSKSMSTMFSSVVSISPSETRRAGWCRSRSVFPRHRKHLGRDQRPGREVEARVADGGELAEEQLDRLLFRADRVEGVERPEPMATEARRAERAAGELEPVAATAAAAAAERPPRPPIRTRSCSCPLRTISSISGIC
jgi:hypothetical protein